MSENKKAYDALRNNELPAEHNGADAQLIQKIAKECSFEDFNNFVEDDETPPINLSAEEMELLSGGKDGKGRKRWAKLLRAIADFLDP